MVREEIRRGYARSVDEIIHAGVQAIHEKLHQSPAGETDARNLVELFANSPFKGLDVEFERERDYGRDVEL
jgi:hypothetical protein